MGIIYTLPQPHFLKERERKKAWEVFMIRFVWNEVYTSVQHSSFIALRVPPLPLPLLRRVSCLLRGCSRSGTQRPSR